MPKKKTNKKKKVAVEVTTPKPEEKSTPPAPSEADPPKPDPPKPDPPKESKPIRSANEVSEKHGLTENHAKRLPWGYGPCQVPMVFIGTEHMKAYSAKGFSVIRGQKFLTNVETCRYLRGNWPQAFEVLK